MLTSLPLIAAPEFKTPNLSELQLAEHSRHSTPASAEQKPKAVELAKAAASAGDIAALTELLRAADRDCHGSPLPQLDLILSLPDIAQSFTERTGKIPDEISAHIKNYLGYAGGVADPTLKFALAMVELAQDRHALTEDRPVAVRTFGRSALAHLDAAHSSTEDTASLLFGIATSIAGLHPHRSAAAIRLLLDTLSVSGSLAHDTQDLFQKKLFPKYLNSLVSAGHEELAKRIVDRYFGHVRRIMTERQKIYEVPESLGTYRTIGFSGDGAFTAHLTEPALAIHCIDHLIALEKSGFKLLNSKERIDTSGPLTGIAEHYRGERHLEIRRRAIGEAYSQLLAKYSLEEFGSEPNHSRPQRPVPRGLFAKIEKIRKELA